MFWGHLMGLVVFLLVLWSFGNYSGEIECVRDIHSSVYYLVWSIAAYRESDVYGGNMESYLVPALVPRLEFFDYCYCSRCFIDTFSVIVFNLISRGEDIFLQRRWSCCRQSLGLFSLVHVGAHLWVNMLLSCN